jgi:hypothetical protein
VTVLRDSELLRVATFPLMRQYTPALFDRVEKELSVRMAQVAQQTGGTLKGQRTVKAGGIESHQYDVGVGDHVDQYTFVLSGKREYQLLCRRKSSSKDDFCQALVTSFAPA